MFRKLMHLGLPIEGESTTTGIDDCCATVTNREVKFSISAALKLVGQIFRTMRY